MAILLSSIYFCGLQKGESLNLKFTDILNERSLLFIRQAKGKKDRIVKLSEKSWKIFQKYREKVSPTCRFIYGNRGYVPNTASSLNKLFKQVLGK